MLWWLLAANALGCIFSLLQEKARFLQNLAVAKRASLRVASSTQSAPDVSDQAVFPDIGFASSAAVPQRRMRQSVSAEVSGRGEEEVSGGASLSRGDLAPDVTTLAGATEFGGWDGGQKFEDAEVITGR